MADLNMVVLVGRLGRDPEMIATQSGGELANLSVATSERWRDKVSGERRERTEWHRVVVFKPGTVAFVRDYARKGALVLVRGKLQTRKWTDRDGNERYTTEVVVAGFEHDVSLLGRASGSDEAGGGDGAPEQRPAAKPERAGGGFEDLDDDIPF